MMTHSNSHFHPLLPKTTQDFSGGNAPGQWHIEGVSLFNRIGNSLDFESGTYNEINSIPSPWSKALQFISAMRNEKYPSRRWLMDQYRGILAAIALSENLNLGLKAVRVDLQTYQNNEFGRCLWKLKPSEEYNVLSVSPPDGPWLQLFLLELEGNAIGFTSPATLMVPIGYLKPDIERRIPWAKNGFFTDPINNGLNPTHKSLLASWLQNLHGELLKNPINRTLAGEVAAELDKFRQALGITQLAIFEPSDNPAPFGEPLAPAPLDALKPAKMVKQDSNVRVLYSTGLTPRKQLYLIDPIKLPALMGRDAGEINVIDSSSLAHLPPNLFQRSDALFVNPADLFAENLFYSKTKGMLPGTWLDRKLNLDNLSILLPLNPILKDYFNSQDLDSNISLNACNTPEGPGIRITLTLKVSGFNQQPVQYSAYKEFPLKAENELTQAFPTLALWPNVPPSQWREYFVFIEVSEGFGGLAFNIEQPTDRATQETRQSGQEKYRYWKCDRHPEILSVMDKNARFLGLLPLNIPQVQVGNAATWTVGVDFGTSFTNIYVRKGKAQPTRFNLQSNLLRITKGLETEEAITYREFFIPDIFLPEGKNPPLSTILTTRGGQELESQVPEVISHARIYVPRLDRLDFNEDYIKTNIKWQQIQYQQPFLSQLLRLIAAQAAKEGVTTIEWAYSYPSAFSLNDEERYEVVWQKLLTELGQISGQTHRPTTEQALRTESIAFAQFFGDILGKDLVHTTCVDIGGGTSDISIWQKNQLIHQVSVPYAGRDIFHQILKPNLAFIGEIFLGSDGELLGQSFENLATNSFNASLDNYLRNFGDQVLTNGYVMNADKQRSREFRTLVAFAIGGLYHYLGLVQNYLNHQEEMFQNQGRCTSILVGGNGSRFLHWLTTSGRYSERSEVNALLQGIVSRASGLAPHPDFMSLSPQPKDEACGGLVVLPSEDKLQGWQGKRKNAPFLGESCLVNGQIFNADQRLEISKDFENIEDFQITSFQELERYLASFNAIISEADIQQIPQLRHFDQGGLLTLTEHLRTRLQTSVTKICLRKKGSARSFEREPAFLITLRCFVGLLAQEWSKTAN